MQLFFRSATAETGNIHKQNHLRVKSLEFESYIAIGLFLRTVSRASPDSHETAI